MPAQVESCVSSLMSKWKSNPSSRPPAKEKGQDAKSQAWAICQAAYNKSVKNSLELMLEGDGYGPTLIGAAATNRPYIPKLKPTRVVEEDGKKYLLVHLANSGHFSHPTGPFTLDWTIFGNMIQNFSSKVLGQDAAYDCRHKPDEGAYGWFIALMHGDQLGEGRNEFWGKVEPTPLGLEKIQSGAYRYSSMEFHRNYKRDDVVLDLERATEDFCLVLEENTEVNMGDQNENADDRLVKLEAEKVAAEERAKAAEEAAKKAQDRAIALETEAMNSSIQAIVELSQTRRDTNGNALPRQLIEWVSKFLKFEALGENGVVKLEDGARPNAAVMKYMIGAVRTLLLEMPGMVPAEQKTEGGSSDQDDSFDYKKMWED